MKVSSSLCTSQRPNSKTIGQRLPRPPNYGHRNNVVLWTTGAAKVDIILEEPTIESVAYEV